MKYYPINEMTARVAHEINSFRDYPENNATNGYKAAVDQVYTIADQIADKKPQFATKAYYMADRYAKKYADYLNAYYRNEASCPSVMICGPANFPTRKKEKQNARRDTLMAEYNRLEAYKTKLSHILTHNQPILSSDESAIELLQDKISDLEHDKQLMKDINAYYRKNRTLEGFDEDIPATLMRHINFMLTTMAEITKNTGRIFDTSNTNAEIKRLQARLDKLQELKEAGTSETQHEGFTVVENTEIMRLQILFDDIPDAETRDKLKHNGFKWSPKNQAWQRQLTDNAKYSLKRILPELA